MTTDGRAVIISSRDYVLISELQTCEPNKKVKINSIDKDVGFLVDVNVEHSIYLALDAISTAPLSFLATVAKIGSRQNLVSLPGVYKRNKSLKQLQRFGFTYDEAIAAGRISPDGRYVSPAGEPDCRNVAYPGVWDLAENRRVILSGDDDRINSQCRKLFLSDIKQ
jgi:hypothetical protein